MQLLAAWKDSLTIFKPDNCRLFALVTLNSLVKSYQVWLRYWGWLAILYFLFQAISFKIGLLLTPFLINITFFLSVRPSVKIKNYAYFSEYAVRSLYVILFFAIWFVGLGSWISLKMQSVPAGSAFTYEANPRIFAALFLGMITDFYTLFIFDSRGTLQEAVVSVWRAVKMFLFNFPFCLIFMVFTGLLMYATLLISHLGSLTIPPIINIFIFFPLAANIVTNFYVKKVHEQYSIYFGAK